MATDTLQTLIDLLKQPSSPRPTSSNDSDKPESTSSGSNIKPPQSDHNQENKPTIFDLQSSDRYRVLKLIEELIDTQEEVDQLKQKLEDQRSEFREKRSVLIKRLDLLSEKHGKALSDIKKLKETHSASLSRLEEKISLVSQKFEESASTVEKLRQANSDLMKENLELLKINSHVSATIANMKEENSALSLQLKESKHKEKSLQKQLKQLSLSELLKATFSSESAKSNSTVFSFPQQSMQPTHEQKSTKHISSKGAGDYHIPPSSSGFTTIKAPIKLNSEKQEKISTADTAAECVPNSNDFLNAHRTENINNDSLDSALIENLFFRF